MTHTFKPRIDSYYSISALSGDLCEPRLLWNQKLMKLDYKCSIRRGTPTIFDIVMHKKKSILVDGTPKLYKIVHETVASLLMEDTDQKLSTIGVTGSDGNLTPDYIDQGRKIVVELTTTTNSDPRNAEDRFRDKVLHYRDALKDVGYGIGVVLVGETFVYTNIEMSQELVDSLCHRCRTGVGVKSAVEGYLGVALASSEMSSQERLVRRAIKQMDGDSGDSKDFPITEILKCCDPPSESDHKISLQIIKDCLRESKQSSLPTQKDLQSYLNSYDQNYRDDQKRVTNVPCVERVSEGVIPDLDPECSDMPNFLKNIWLESKSVRFATQDEKLCKVDAMFTEDSNQHKIQKESAFNVKLSQDDLVESSKTGLWGKSQKSKQEYQTHRAHGHLSFHPTRTDTDDIESFIRNTNMLEDCGTSAVEPSIMSLIKDAKSVWKSEGDTSKAISEIMFESGCRTRLINFASLVTGIFTEICYCYKYWIGRSDFYSKRYKDVTILVRCTGTHIFCTMAFPKSNYRKWDTGRLGPNLYESTDYYYSDVSSYTEPVVEHFVKAGPHMASLLFHQLAASESELKSDFSKSVEIGRDLNGLLMLYLNNKTDSEEVMTNQRYLTMGVLEDLDPNPYRFVERLPGFLKSRLTVYLVKRTISLMKRYEIPPIRVLVKDGDISNMEYDGLVGFFSNEKITFKRKIEEFYFGYVISKEKGRGGDRNFKIMSKIVQQEFKYRDDGHNPFSHGRDTEVNQTNLPLLRTMMGIFKSRMEDFYGSEWRAVMEKKIIERLARLSFLETATLKVSSRNYDGVFNVPVVDDTMSTAEIKEKLTIMNPDDVAQRPRAMESLNNLVDEFKLETGVVDVEHIIQLVPWCLKKLEDRGYFYSDIFPKPQHGGDREIHVLEIKARVVQLFTETVSRSLCDMIPSDTLMHPRWKTSFVGQHYKTAESELDSHRITLGKSADASKWCQRNHASKFAATMSCILPMWILRPILRILYLWTTKVICFPIQFVANFLRNKTVKSNPTYERMRSEFYNGTGIFKTAVSNRMVIKSGMMQGILHYTSSFVHGMIQESNISLQKRLLKKEGIRSVITMAQGSDDSSEMISLSGSSVSRMLKVGVTMLMLKERVSSRLGIETSRAKSCIGSSDMVEYNSEWWMRRSSVKPTFRWVSACLEVGVVEKFIDRIHNFYGTATDVLESGGKILEVSLIQMCQAWMHYHMLGLSTHVLRDNVATKIANLKDPALGYFPLDSDYNAGITGVDFQLYKLHKSTSYGHGVGADRISQNEMEMFSEDAKDPSVSQSLRRIRLKFGNHRIFKSLIRRMSVPELETLLVEVEKDPKILYYPSHSWDSSRTRIYMKLFEPGVKESLSKHSATARILSASAYMISRPCIVSSYSDSKVSLFRALITEDMNRVMGISMKMNIEEVFLYHEEYEDTLKDIESIASNHVIQKVNMKSRSKQTIVVFDRVITDVSVIEMCKQSWFGDGRTGLTLRQFNIKWAELKDRFSFLSDSRVITKENLCMSEVQLKNFITSIDTRPRKLTLMDTAARGSSVRSTMTRMFWPNVKLLKTRSEDEEDTASSIRSKIFSILTHWASEAEKLRSIGEIITRSSTLKHRHVPAKLRKLKCMRDVLMAVDKRKIVDNIISEKIGSLGVFTIRQNGWGVNRTGYGEWKGKVLESDVVLTFDSTTCSSITVNSMKNKRDLGPALVELVRNFSSNFPDTPTDSDHWLTPDGVINGGRGVMTAIPIFIDQDLKVTIFDKVEEWEWNVKINRNSIRLIAVTNRGENVTLLSDIFRSYEWDPIYSMDKGEFMEWNNNEIMDMDRLGSELSRLFNGSDIEIDRQLGWIAKGTNNIKSVSGWNLRNLRGVLRSFFNLKVSKADLQPESKPAEEDIMDLDEDMMLSFQMADFEADVDFEEELEDIGDFEFDMSEAIKGYIEDSIELLLGEREVSMRTSLDTMPPTNNCFSSLELLCKATTKMSFTDVFKSVNEDPTRKYTGLLGKILTLITNKPKMRHMMSRIEADILSREENSVSATHSLRTQDDAERMSTEDLEEHVAEVESLMRVTRRPQLLDTLNDTRNRYVRMLQIRNIRVEENGVSDIVSRDFFLWFRDESGYLNAETNVLFRLTDSAYIIAMRDRLESNVEEMCRSGKISEYELGLYREAIPRGQLSTLVLDVFSDYFGLSLKVGPYFTNTDEQFDYEYCLN